MGEIKRKSAIQNELMRSVSAVLLPYQIRFAENTRFLCEYTGLNYYSLSSRMKAFGCPSPLNTIKRVEKNDNVGMEMLLYAGVAKVFGIPFALIFDFDLWKMYEDGDFVPEKYGIFKNSMHPRKNMKKTPEARLNPVPYKSAKKKLSKAIRYNQIQREKEIVNARAFLIDNGV